MRSYYIQLALISTTLVTSVAGAAQLSIPNVPLFMQQETPANVLFVMDDSGSMDWEMLVKPHWEKCNYDPDTSYSQCNTTKQDDGIFHFSEKTNGWGGKRFNSRSIYYLFNLNNVYGYYSALNFPELINEDWRVFDNNFNGLAYNPSTTYTPWAGYCEGNKSSNYVACGNSNFSNAHSYPHKDHNDYSTTVNLGNYRFNNNGVQLPYVVSVDDKKFSGNEPNKNNIVTGSNGIVDPWDSNALIQFVNGGTISVSIQKTDALANQSVIQSVNLNGSACYDALGPNNLVQEIINGTRSISATNGVGCRTVSDAQQNYANWFEYSRRRSLSAKASVSYIMSQFSGLYYGLSYINDSNIKNTLPGQSDDLVSSDNTLLRDYFLQQQQAVGTPLVTAVNTAGRYYSGLIGSSPIKSSCQRNFSIVMTDGYWNDSASQRPKLGDVDGDGYGSSASMLSDVAYYYYKNDLATGLANNVAPTKDDPNTKQHMNTIGIAFGPVGDLVAGSDGWPTPSLGISGNWGDPGCNDDCSAKINDLWHAAFNSKGKFFSAGNYAELQSGLNTSLQGILDAMAGSTGSASSNSSMLIGNSAIYQAQFKNSDWSGDLRALNINANGTINISAPKWSAASQLNSKSPNSRVIYSYNGSKGVPFKWPSNYKSPTSSEMPKSITELLVSDASNSKKASVGSERISYLRGDRSKEIANGGTYRTRSSVLGDIIHSGSVYVAPPSALYTDPFYITFKETYKNRPPMIFTGANDGMLHGFNADTGSEIMGYVPGHPNIWRNLQSLTKSDYAHRYFVDRTPAVGDFFVASSYSWRTALAGGLGMGGQGVYALDITDGSFTDSAVEAAKKVIWEFTDANDKDLGYILDTPQIVRMYNKKWAVIFGNGYNNTATTDSSGNTDSYVSTTGQAALFIVFLEGGVNGTWVANTDFVKIPVGATGTKNGLSQPTAIDINGDFTADYIYAGDLNGDLWKFDVRNKTPSNWKLTTAISKLYSAGSPAGNGSQPIIQAPVVAPHPLGLDKGFLVYFGTGKYLESSDTNPANQSTQTMYAIWDKNGTTKTSFSGTTTLLSQQIYSEVGNYRAVSNNTINWTTHNGWYLPLTLGERVISRPVLRNGRVIFTTLIPSGSSAEAQCQTANLTSWLMELNAKNGGRLNASPFDKNADNQFDSSDYIEFTEAGKTVKAPPGGLKSEVGMTAMPTIMSTQDGNTEVKILSGSGGISSVVENPGTNVSGRQTWQEVN